MRTDEPTRAQGSGTTRKTKAKAPPRPVATPWGSARTVEHVSIPQRAGTRRFATVVELLETAEGEHLVRFAYSTDGTARRGPVTLQARDLARLQKQLAGAPGLREALRVTQ